MSNLMRNVTILDLVVAAIVVIVAIIGGIAMLTDSTSLNFQEYVDVLVKLMIGVGLYGIGKGVVVGAKTVAANKS